MSEVGSLNLKDLSKRAFSYFGGLSKAEVKQLINYTMIIENANGNLRGSLTSMSGRLKDALDEIEELKADYRIVSASETISQEALYSCKGTWEKEKQELEKHISELNQRLEEKQALVDEANKEAASLRENNDFFLRKLKDIKEEAEDAL